MTGSWPRCPQSPRRRSGLTGVLPRAGAAWCGPATTAVPGPSPMPSHACWRYLQPHPLHALPFTCLHAACQPAGACPALDIGSGSLGLCMLPATRVLALREGKALLGPGAPAPSPLLVHLPRVPFRETCLWAWELGVDAGPPLLGGHVCSASGIGIYWGQGSGTGKSPVSWVAGTPSSQNSPWWPGSQDGWTECLWGISQHLGASVSLWRE